MAPISMKLLGMATLVASANMMAANAQATNVELCSDVGGIASGGVCCLESCGDCGGSGCPSRTGGAENCCVGQIVDAGVSCDDAEAPCILEEGTFVEEGEEGEEVDDDEEGNEVVPTPSPATTNSPDGAPTAEPTTAAPTTVAPTSSAPTSSAPTSSAPTSSAPTTSAPTSSAPTTSAPTSSAPTSSAPTTTAPTTAAPTTSAPTTSAPTTPAPSTPIGGGVISTMAPTPGSRGGDFGTTSSDTMSPTVSATGVGSGSGSDIDGLDFTEAPTAAPTGAPSGADDSRDPDVDDDDAIEGASGALGMLATRPFSGGAAYAWGALGLAMASAAGMLL